MKNPYKNIKLFTLLAAMVAMVGCSNDDDNLKQGDLSFEITSSDFECVSGEEQAVSVPAEGQIYSFMVNASDATSWTVTLEGGAWITVNPVAKQRGSGEIVIKAAENSYNESNRSALISITNTANEEVYTYRFNQEYDAESVKPEYHYYTYRVGELGQSMTFKVENINLTGNIDCAVIPDNEKLDIENYSILYEAECEILDNTCYSDLKFENNTLSLTFIKNKLTTLSKKKSFILPITLSQEEKTLRRIWVIANVENSGEAPTGDEMPQLKLTENNLYINNWRWSSDRRNLVDGDLNTQWQSEFNGNKPNRRFDEKYGVYIDVTLPADNDYKFIAFNYATGNMYPHMPYKVEIYIGESKEQLDKKEVEAAHTYIYDGPIPRTQKAWFIEEKMDMPVFALKGIKAKVVRIAFLQRHHGQYNSAPDNLTNTSYNPGETNAGVSGAPSVIASEIAIYAL